MLCSAQKSMFFKPASVVNLVQRIILPGLTQLKSCVGAGFRFSTMSLFSSNCAGESAVMTIFHGVE